MSFVSYYPVEYRVNSEERCGICLDPLLSEEENIVAHNDRNSSQLLHPMHVKCIREWIERDSICPYCRQPVDLNSLIPLRERAMKLVKWMTEDVLVGMITVGGIQIAIEVGEIVAREGNSLLEGISATMITAIGIIGLGAANEIRARRLTLSGFRVAGAALGLISSAVFTVGNSPSYLVITGAGVTGAIIVGQLARRNRTLRTRIRELQE